MFLSMLQEDYLGAAFGWLSVHACVLPNLKSCTAVLHLPLIALNLLKIVLTKRA